MALDTTLIMLILLFFGVILATFFTWVTSHIFQLQRRRFKWAIAVGLTYLIVSLIQRLIYSLLNIPLTQLNVYNFFIGAITSIIIMVYAVMKIYQLSFWKALAVYLVSIVLAFGSGFIIFFFISGYFFLKLLPTYI